MSDEDAAVVANFRRDMGLPPDADLRMEMGAAVQQLALLVREGREIVAEAPEPPGVGQPGGPSEAQLEELREGEEALGQGRALVESQGALVRQLVAQVRVGEQALAVKERELDDSLARSTGGGGVLLQKCQVAMLSVMIS